MQDHLRTLIEQTVAWLPRLAVALLLVLIFWLLVKLISRIIANVSAGLELDENVAMLIGRSVRVALWALGTITVLGTLGIDVTAMVAGLGLTGFALGFALKDTISNMLSGVLILLYRPFQVGDCIKIAGYEGEVVSIDLRYTVIKGDADKVFIPNSKLFTDPVSVVE